VTSNLPFDEWTSVFGSERLTGALLDRVTHHVHILELNGESYRLAQSKRRSRRSQQDSTLHQTAADWQESQNDSAHRSKINYRSVRALAVKSRACGAPLQGFGTWPLGTTEQMRHPCR
jgi:hypothetical protein